MFRSLIVAKFARIHVGILLAARWISDSSLRDAPE